MAVPNEKPSGISEQHQRQIVMTQDVHILCQGSWGKYYVWLEMECGARVMIGAGTQEEATAEAVVYLTELATKVRPKMEQLIKATIGSPLGVTSSP